MKKKRNGCPTGKVGYCNHRWAMMAVNLLADESSRDRVPQRAYKCEICGRWHLTSRLRRRETCVIATNPG